MLQFPLGSDSYGFAVNFNAKIKVMMSIFQSKHSQKHSPEKIDFFWSNVWSDSAVLKMPFFFSSLPLNADAVRTSMKEAVSCSAVY